MSSARNNSLTSLLRRDVAQAKTALDNARTAAAKLPGYDQTPEFLKTVQDTKTVFKAAGATSQEIAAVENLTASSYEASIVTESVGQRLAASGQSLPRRIAPLLRQPVAAPNATPSGSVEVVNFTKAAKSAPPAASVVSSAEPLASAAANAGPILQSVEPLSTAGKLASGARSFTSGAGLVLTGGLLVAGTVGTVAEAAKSADEGDPVKTTALVTLGAGQATGSILWLSGKLAADAATAALGARIAMLSSLPGLMVAALWPSPTADSTPGAHYQQSFEPGDEPWMRAYK